MSGQTRAAPAALAPALLPLSLLEAVRNLDTPVDDGLELLATDVVARRLGLSATVAAQIARYRDAAARRATVADEELVAVLRLVGRRPDAELVFADAGRRAARHAIRAGGGSVRAVLRLVPGRVARRLGVRAARRLAAAYFRGALDVRGGLPEITMPAPPSVRAVADGTACGFYGAAYGELLRMLIGFEGVMLHEACCARGDATCRWRAEPAGGYE